MPRMARRLPNISTPSKALRSHLPASIEVWALADVAGQRQHQGKGVFRGGDRVAARGVHHDHAVVGGGRAVDIVHADSRAADGLEVFRGSEYFGGDLGIGADDQAVVVADDFQQFIGFQTGALGSDFEIHGNLRGRAKRFHAFF